jgi:hypothetical protein
MKQLFATIAFIDHLFISFILIDLIGSFMVDSVSVLKTMWYGLLIFGIIISIVFHIKYIFSVFIYKK